MTIPEPTTLQSEIDLRKWYGILQDNGELGPNGQDILIRRAYHAERERDQLRAKLHDSDRIGTHYDGCWDSGRRHYGCAVAEIAKLRARVAELEGHIRSLMPFMNMDSAIWSSICTKCGKMSYSHGRYLVRNGGTDRTGTCKHCPYMNAFHLMIPQPSSLMELEAKVKHG